MFASIPRGCWLVVFFFVLFFAFLLFLYFLFVFLFSFTLFSYLFSCLSYMPMRFLCLFFPWAPYILVIYHIFCLFNPFLSRIQLTLCISSSFYPFMFLYFFKFLIQRLFFYTFKCFDEYIWFCLECWLTIFFCFSWEVGCYSVDIYKKKFPDCFWNNFIWICWHFFLFLWYCSVL